MENNTYVVPPKPKKSKTGLIIGIVAAVIVLAGVGGFLYYINRPIYKVEKALENNDMETVCEYYDRLTAVQKDEVDESILDYCEDLYDKYEDEEADYDEIMEELEMIEDDALGSNQDFQEILKKVDTLKSSREAFTEAEELFKNEDYKAAAEKYSEVADFDKNYKKANEKREECFEIILKELEGTWVFNANVGEAILRQAGYPSDDSFEFIMLFKMDFNADGTGRLYLDGSNHEENMEKIVDYVIDYEIKHSNDPSMTPEELDKLFRSVYGTSFKEFMMDAMRDSIDPEEIYGEDASFTYTNDFDTIHVEYDDGGSDEYTFEDGRLVMDNASTETTEIFRQMSIEFPIYFDKE